MTANSNSATTVRRSLVALASAGLIGGVLAGCTPNEPRSDTPGTTPAVVTGDQAPVDADQHPTGPPSSGPGATANLIDASGKTVGEATFATSGSSVRVTVKLDSGSGISAGFHGLHLHQNGVCQGSGAEAFTSAGGHLQVDGHTGHPSSGDLVSLNVLADGTAETVTTTDSVKLDQIVNKSIVIHAGADNFANIPTRYAPAPDEQTMKTGDAGARVACGVIEKK